MNDITKTIMESLEETVESFDKFQDERVDATWQGYYHSSFQEPLKDFLKSHLLQSQIKVIEAVIEQRKSELDQHEQNIVRDGNWGHTYGQGKKDGVSEALENQISSLNETLEFIKKSL